MKVLFKNIMLATSCYFLLLYMLRLSFWQSVDTAITLWLIQHRQPWLTTVFMLVTHLADQTTVIAILISITIFALIKKRYFLIFSLITTSGLCAAVNSGIKLLIQRERPQFSQLLYESSSSFPSGHASAALSLYGNITLHLLQHIESKILRYLIIGGSLVIIFAIGFSRIYLGVHWFSDILGGYGTALYSIYLTRLFYKESKKNC